MMYMSPGSRVSRARPRLVRPTACGLVLLTLGLSSALAALPVRIVDTGTDGTARPDVVVSGDDEVLVAYRHAADNALKLARVGCGEVAVTTLYSEGAPGMYASLQLDSLGLPSVVHEVQGGPFGSGLYFTLDGSPLFGLSTVVIDSGQYYRWPTYDLDDFDRPFTAYLNQNGQAYVAFFDITSGAWTTQPLPAQGRTIGPEHNIVLAINGAGEPVVAVYDVAELSVLTLGEGGWSVRTHSLAGVPLSRGLALAFDSVDAPHVAYAATDGLRIYRFHALGVTEQAVVTNRAVRIGPHSLVIDAGNRIWSGYLDESTGPPVLRVAENNGGWFSTEAYVGNGLTPPSLILDADGHWLMAFADAAEGAVKLVGTSRLVGKPADFDCDGDVDADDHALFEQCAAGPAIPMIDPMCGPADFDVDMDVDHADFSVFQRCRSGSDVPSDPTCAD